MPVSSLTNRTLKGFFWLFAGKGAQSVLQVVVLMVLARLLSPAEFGVVGAAMVVIGFSQIFSELGVGPAIVQRVELDLAHIRAGFTLSILFSSLTGVVIMLSAPMFATFFRMPELEPIVRFLAVIFPVTGLAVVGEALLQREMRFKKLTAIGLVSYVFGYGMVGIVLAATGFGVWALAIAQLSQAAMNAFMLLWVRREVIGVTFDKTKFAQLLNFGAGLSLAKIANYLARQIDNFVVGRWLGADALGAYGRAYQFLMTPTNLFGSVMNQVLFPAMASVQNDKEKLARAYTRALAVIAMVALPVSGILVVLAPEIVAVLLGPQWGAVVVPFQVLAAFLLFRTSYKISDSLARALGVVYQSAWRQWVYAFAVLIGAWLGHFAGLGGVALGVGLAVCLHFFLMLQLSVHVSGASWRELASIHIRHLSFALVISGITWLVTAVLRAQGVHALVTLAGGGLVAAATLALAWTVGGRYLAEEGVWVRTILKEQLFNQREKRLS